MATGIANAVAAIGSSIFSLGPIAGYRFNLKTQSCAGASVTLVVNQAGIG